MITLSKERMVDIMTQKQALQWAIDKANESAREDVASPLQNLLCTISKKSVKTEDPRDTELKAQILEFMVGKGKLRCTTIGDHLGVTQSKASALLKKLVDTGQVTREKDGKVTYFSI